jgi:putative hydrolase of the HAD superfamily
VPIRGLIFDFGGVIGDMRWDVMWELEHEHSLERGTLARTLYDIDEWRAVQVGQGDTEVWREASHRRLEEVAGRPLPRLHEQWRSTGRLIAQNVELIRALRPPYRIGVLSNADRTLEERIGGTAGLAGLFDDVVCSAVVGLAKPDREIYLLAARRLAVPPEECLFVDDARRNVEAARTVGMTAVHYRVHEGDDLAALLAEQGIRPA